MDKFIYVKTAQNTFHPKFKTLKGKKEGLLEMQTNHDTTSDRLAHFRKSVSDSNDFKIDRLKQIL